jgi:hypothetical protein
MRARRNAAPAYYQLYVKRGPEPPMSALRIFRAILALDRPSHRRPERLDHDDFVS